MLEPAVTFVKGYRERKGGKKIWGEGDSPAVSVPAGPPPATRIVEASGRDLCICLNAAIDSS